MVCNSFVNDWTLAKLLRQEQLLRTFFKDRRQKVSRTVEINLCYIVINGTSSEHYVTNYRLFCILEEQRWMINITFLFVHRSHNYYYKKRSQDNHCLDKGPLQSIPEVGTDSRFLIRHVQRRVKVSLRGKIF